MAPGTRRLRTAKNRLSHLQMRPLAGKAEASEPDGRVLLQVGRMGGGEGQGKTHAEAERDAEGENRLSSEFKSLSLKKTRKKTANTNNLS